LVALRASAKRERTTDWQATGQRTAIPARVQDETCL
jgi:hypothetical protein